MKNTKTLGIAGGLVAAALVGGTLISAALAAPSAPGASASAANLANGEYCEAWQAAFADQLGVSVDDLLPAAKAASIAAIDAAVAAGDLTEERATALKDKIAAADGSNACRFFGHPFARGGHGPKAHFGGPLLSVAAEALGIEPGELKQALRSGDSLQDVATAQGKDYDTVSQAILDAAKTRLDAAVAEGLDQARADEILSKLDEALASGDLSLLHPGRGHVGFHGLDDDEADASESEAPST
ncbi:MAG: hypothetical protein WD402_08305 [Chloroflexota bacterium]